MGYLGSLLVGGGQKQVFGIKKDNEREALFRFHRIESNVELLSILKLE